MKTSVSEGNSVFTKTYVNRTYSNGSVVRYVEGMEIELLMIVLQQMNMTFFMSLYQKLLERAADLKRSF